MARVLIPTDFSDNAMHAAEYAVKLFGAQGNHYILLHTYVDPGIADPMMPSMTRELMKVTEEGLQDFADRLVRRTGAERVKQEVLYGTPSSVVNEAARSAGAQVVVMGKRGRTGSAIFGSNTIDVIKHSNVPVLVVPESAPIKPVKCILLADDHEEVLPQSLDLLRQLARLSDAEVLVTYVPFAAPAGGAHWSEGINDLALKDVRHSFLEVPGADVIDGLERTARHKQVDLIAVLHRHIGLLGRLLHPSTAKELALHGDRPLLVLEQEA